jgi:hypothetical protein
MLVFTLQRNHSADCTSRAPNEIQFVNDDLESIWKEGAES